MRTWAFAMLMSAHRCLTDAVANFSILDGSGKLGNMVWFWVACTTAGVCWQKAEKDTRADR
jgi:hypothetical protein